MTITIGATTVNASTNFPGSTCTLRIYCSIGFTPSDGTFVMDGRTGSFYKPVSCTISAGIISIPSFTIPSTTDGLDYITARYTAIFYDSKNVKRDIFFDSFQVPTTYGSTVTWSQLRIFKTGRQPIRNIQTYTKEEVNALIALASGTLNDASDVVKGRAYSDVPPAVASAPTFVGLNSRRTVFSYNVTSTAIGATGDGVTDDRAALNTLVNTTLQIAGAGGRVLFPPGTYLIGSNMTFPANVVLDLDPRAVLKPANGVTITDLTDHSSWDNNQKFTNALAGQGTISFSGNGSLREIRPEWWATNTTPGTTVMHTAIQAAMDAATAISKVYLSATTYAITNSLTATGTTALWIDGTGLTTKILNLASANKPTFALTSKRYFDLTNLSIIGRIANPNKGIEISGGGFGNLYNVFLCPNGIGLHISDLSTLHIDRVDYWPSGFNNGATGTQSLLTNAILADGTFVNDVHISRVNSVGYASIADGGAGIKWDTPGLGISQGISIRDCELEGAGLRAIDIAGAFDVKVENCYLDNANVRVIRSRRVVMEISRGSTGTTYTIGDGTAPNASMHVLGIGIAGDAFTVSANNDQCGLIASYFNTYTNSGTNPVTISTVAGGINPVADQLGSMGIKTYGRSVSQGEWTTPTFAAGDFTSDSGTWVVAAGDVVTYEYMLVGKTMFLNFKITTSTTTGTPQVLQIKIPGGFTAAKSASTNYIRNNNGGAYATSEMGVLAGGTVVFLYFDLNGVSNWAAGADNTNVRGMIKFDVG